MSRFLPALLCTPFHLLAGLAIASTGIADSAGDEQALAREVSAKGWILSSARTAQGDYDLFLCRPDGSARRNLTRTADLSEYGGRFSPDSKRLLYRRERKGPMFKPGEGIPHGTWGTRGVLVLANSDGSCPQPQGAEGEWPWASWSPDGKQIACLYRREGVIRIIDLETKRLIRELPRHGIFQHLFWSPDGKRLCGTANVNGQDWNILAVNLDDGRTTLLSRGLNCTADWFQGDGSRVIYSNRTPGLADAYGWTMLMQASASGRERTLVYGEKGRHIYYGCTSPDDRYVAFSRPESDGGTEGNLALIRLADAPIIVPPDYLELRSLYPGAKAGPVLYLDQPGFEPHWTYAEIAEP